MGRSSTSWKPGQSGNPKGRAPREAERDFLGLLAAAVSPKDWRAIAVKAVEQAKRGNSEARKWLASYLIGLPVQRLEHSGPDGGPIVTRRAEDMTDDELAAIAARGGRPTDIAATSAP